MHEELGYYVEAGMTPYEALSTSTKNVSLYLEDQTSGTIQVGNRADLVLLRANPLTDISNIKAIEGIFTQGTWLSKKNIDETKVLIKKLYEN
jgi:imidazolonepropionase-like amidohydrolase